jgi:hypothetical protein
MYICQSTQKRTNPKGEHRFSQARRGLRANIVALLLSNTTLQTKPTRQSDNCTVLRSTRNIPSL